MQESKENGLEIKHLCPEIQEYINHISEMYQAPRDMVTLAVYVATAVAAGSRITTNDGIFTNKLYLWAIVVGISGAGKSKYANKIFEPILRKNEKLVADHNRAKKEWSGKGEKPQGKNFHVSVITLEAILEKIALLPDGLFLFRNELSGWVGSFGKYNKDESEYATWIEIWDGDTIPANTKTCEEKFINAKDPVLSIFGGVQPHIMKRFARPETIGTGFLGRILKVYPPLFYPASPPSGEFNPKLLGWWDAFIESIYSTTAQLHFSNEAKAVYNDYCYGYVREKVLEIGENTIDPYEISMLEFYGKIKIYAEKWAGIAMLLSGKSGWIDEEIMRDTIADMKVFEEYTKKTYNFIFGSPMKDVKTKGDIIRKLDAEFGVKNQSALAESLGLDRSMISKYLKCQK